MKCLNRGPGDITRRGTPTIEGIGSEGQRMRDPELRIDVPIVVVLSLVLAADITRAGLREKETVPARR